MSQSPMVAALHRELVSPEETQGVKIRAPES